MQINLKEILAAFMVLFAIIDIPGSIPIILDIKSKTGEIEPLKATLVASAIFLAFLFIGSPLLEIFGIDVFSFAIAGSFIIFLIGMEMVLGIEIFKYHTAGGGSIVPIAFPLIAGAGSITTILSIKAEYQTINIHCLDHEYDNSLSGSEAHISIRKVIRSERASHSEEVFWSNSPFHCNKAFHY